MLSGLLWLMVDVVLYGVCAVLALIVFSFVALCCFELLKSLKPMKDHLLTMHQTDKQDRLWVTCSCGWKTDPVAVSRDAEWEPTKRALAGLGRAHLQTTVQDS